MCVVKSFSRTSVVFCLLFPVVETAVFSWTPICSMRQTALYCNLIVLAIVLAIDRMWMSITLFI